MIRRTDIPEGDGNQRGQHEPSYYEIRRTDIPEGDGNRRLKAFSNSVFILEEPISPKGTETNYSVLFV